MKAFKVVFQHGQFIDLETQKRIIPVQGAEYVISADSDSFTTDDVKLEMEKPLSDIDKARWADNKFGKGNYVKILNAGEQLFFRIGNSKQVQGDESQEYIFLCTLLEDLYLFLYKGRKGNDPKDWGLAECKCMLDRCLQGGMTLTEQIPAESLAKLFCFTVMFYFSMQRSGSTNAFDSFFIYKPGMQITFEKSRKMQYRNLNNFRQDVVCSIIKE